MLDLRFRRVAVRFLTPFVVASIEEGKEARGVVLDQLRRVTMAKLADVSDLQFGVDLPDAVSEMGLKVGVNFDGFNPLGRVRWILVGVSSGAARFGVSVLMRASGTSAWRMDGSWA